MDPIYSSINSHHSISHIDNTIHICSFSLMLIPLILIVFWATFVGYKILVSRKKKNITSIILDSFNYKFMGFYIAIAGFGYLLEGYIALTYACIS